MAVSCSSTSYELVSKRQIAHQNMQLHSKVSSLCETGGKMFENREIARVHSVKLGVSTSLQDPMASLQ